MWKLLTLSLLGVAGVSLASRGSAASLIPYEIRRATLGNGLKVLLIPMPSEGLVTYWTIVRTGARDEVEPGVTGFAHFFEHMMFRGTERYPGPVYDGIVTSMGADANAYTTDDLTAYHLSLTRADLPKVIEIESDRFQNLQYSEGVFRTEAGAVYGEYRKSRTDPGFVLYEATMNRAFDRHTYRHTTIGFEEDIRRMPEQFQYSLGFFRRFYRPENVVVLVAGDFDAEEILDRIRKAYGAWERGYVAPQVPEEPPQTAPRRIDVPFEGQTLPVVSVNFRGERFLPDDPLMAAGGLAGEIGFGESSPLYRKLVLDERRVEDLDTTFGFNRDPKLWSVDAAVKDPADVHAVEAEIWGTIRQLQEAPVEPARLDAARSRLKYSFLSGLTTPYAVASRLARVVAITGDLEAVDRLFATYDRITPEEVRQAAAKYLREDRSTVAILHSAGQEIPAPAAGEPPVLLQVPADPNVVFKVWFRAGSQDDPPGKEGLASLTAAMVAEGGTRRLPYEAILEQLYPLAAAYEASVDMEMTVFTGVAHRDVAEPFYGLFAEALLQPGFRAEDFERLRSRALNRIEKELRYSSDEDLGKAALHGRVFRGTPYGHLPLGTAAGLRSITLEDVRAFHTGRYTRENLVPALGGAFDSRLEERFRSTLGGLPAGRPEPPAAPDPEPLRGRQVLLVEKPGTVSTAISFGHPVDVSRGSREFYALWLANSWLGEHRNSVSHLFQVIRGARGMNYGDYSYIEAFPEGGIRNMPPTGVGRRRQIFEVWIRPVPEDRALFALRAALREVERIARDGLTAEQFEIQREFLRKYSLQFATDTEERLGYALDDRFYGIPDGHLLRFRRMMDEITVEEVNAAIRKHLRPETLVIAMVTGDAAAMARALTSGAPTPIDYAEVKKPEEVLAEDREIASHPLKILPAAVVTVPVEEMFAR